MSKLAKLYAISDVLHNSSSARSSAWTFRSEFEKFLPKLFETLGAALRSGDTIAAKRVRDGMFRVTASWRHVSLFTLQYIQGLEANTTLDTSKDPPRFLQSKVQQWQTQHFSSLEKLCRTRGLRHETTADMDEAERHSFLVKRLAHYEAYSKDNSGSMAQEIAMAQKALDLKIHDAKKAERAALDGERIGGEDDDSLDGESLDGEDLSGSDLDEFVDKEEKVSTIKVGSTISIPVAGKDLEKDLDGRPVFLDGVPLTGSSVKPLGNLDGAPMGNLDGAPMGDLDGAPMGDLDGKPMNFDGVPIGNFDGVPMNIDGKPMNLDGKPM